jgi:multiple sugar transport system substrate-binding protein
MAQSGEAIDVVEMPDRWVSLYSANKLLVDLTPYLQNWPGAKDLTESALQMSRLNGEKPYFLTYGAYIRALVYNKEMFAQAGLEPPKTLDEFEAAARTITEKVSGVKGWCLRGGRGGFVEWWFFMSSLLGVGDWFDAEGKSLFDKPEAIEGMRRLVALYTAGQTPKDSVNWGFNETVAGFYSKTCAMFDGDPDVVIPITQRLGADAFAVVPMPVGPKGIAAPAVGIFGWGIFETSKNKQLAWDLIAQLSTPANNLAWSKFVGVVPIYKGADKDPFYSGPQYAGWFKQLDNPTYKLTPPPGHLPEVGYFFDTMAVEGSQEMLLGSRPVEDVASEWAKYLTEAQQKWLSTR